MKTLQDFLHHDEECIREAAKELQLSLQDNMSKDELEELIEDMIELAEIEDLVDDANRKVMIKKAFEGLKVLVQTLA